MKLLNKLGTALISGITSFTESLLSDTDKPSDLPEKTNESEPVYDTPTAIYLGFSNHDCCSNYRCSVCNLTFDSWMLYNSEDPKCCPHCKTRLKDL